MFMVQQPDPKGPLSPADTAVYSPGPFNFMFRLPVRRNEPTKGQYMRAAIANPHCFRRRRAPRRAATSPVIDMHLHAQAAWFGPDDVAGRHRAGAAGNRGLTFPERRTTRNILYNNAARFLRLSDAQIAMHHGR
jgi:hypothetical protein